MTTEVSEEMNSSDLTEENSSYQEPSISRSTTEVIYNWTDITQEFISDCSTLDLGELLHDDMFGLFEGMSAVEMMDPKMDAGMICNQTKHKVLNLQQSIEAKTVKVMDFTYNELIGIMDDTLACFVTWLEGHSLAQTVFTNLYMHDPCGTIQDPVLKVFCVGVLKLIDIVRDRVNRASVFEEEDFQTMTYNFRLAYELSESQVTGMLRDVEEELNRTMKATRYKPGTDWTKDNQVKHVQAEALYCRLKFLRLFLLFMINVSGKDVGGKSQAGLEDVRKYLSSMKELTAVMERSLYLGVEATACDGDDTCLRVMGFEPLVNQRLLPPTFPRYTKIKTRPDMITYLTSMTSRMLQVCSMTDLTNLHDLMDLFVEFSQTSPCLLSRSLLQLIFLPTTRRTFGSAQLLDVMRETVRKFSAPLALLSGSPIYNNSQVKECMDAFMSQASRPLVSIFQVTGHNRARQRDKWAHQLEDLAVLQDEAEKLDGYIHNMMMKAEKDWVYRASLSSWVLYQTLRVMIRYILSGLELELYSQHEYHYIFWYLCEGLFNWLLSTLSRADSFCTEHETLFAEKVRGGGGGGSGGKKKQKNKPKVRPHLGEITFAQALHSLCGGYYKAVIGLRMDGKLTRPTYEFDCEEVRYNHRFSVFSCINTPPLMPYAQFQEMTDVTRYDPPLQAVDLYNGAAKCFQQTRLHLETISNPTEEVHALIKVAKTNFVVMRVLIGGHKKESNTSPEFDFTLHKLFPVIKP